MLNSIIRLALKYRLMVVVISLATLVCGSYLATTMPIDVFPDLDRPRVVLLTECPGMSPEEVESQVAQPLESSFLGATGVQAVRSQASFSLLVLYVEFDWSVTIRSARQIVQERLAAVAGNLPEGIHPLMTPPSSIMGQIMHVGLSRTVSETDAALRQKQLMDLRTAADWVVRPRLLKVPGVAEVIVHGGERKQYQVLARSDALAEYEVTLHDIEQALRDNNLNTSGGVAAERQGERPIRVLGRLGPEPEDVLRQLRQIPVKQQQPRPILLRQVADVVEGPQAKRGDAAVDGRPGLVITVVKQPHADTRTVTERVNAALREMKSALPAEITIDTELFQLRRFVDRGVYYVAEALTIGAALVVLVLSLFLLNVRTTFITLTAIPLSLVVTTLVFRLIGWLTGSEMSINVMTLGGIAVAMGELVDDAIVDVENIYRRLRLNFAADNPRPILRVVYEASREIRSAIVFGTMVVIIVFLPLFALSGIEGRLFTPLGIAYIVSILASLLISLTVTPVLSYYLLPQMQAAHHLQDGWLLRTLKRLATPLVNLSMRHAGLLLILTWVCVGGAGWLLTRLGADFLPPFDEGSVQINVLLPPGSSLDASNETAAMLDGTLRKFQVSPQNPNGEILHFTRQTGRAELDEHAEPVSMSEYILVVNPKSRKTRQELLKTLVAELKQAAPGVDVEAEQPLAHLISRMLSGVDAQIAIKIFGDDLSQLRRAAEDVKAVISDIPGVTPPVLEPQVHVDELHIRLRPDDLSYYGVSRRDAAELLETALQGTVVSQIAEGPRRFDLALRLADPERTDYGRLPQLRLDLPGQKGPLRLADIADIPAGSGGPTQIYRENAQRRIVIRCNVLDRDLASTVKDIQSSIRRNVKLPTGYYVEYGGQFESQQAATYMILGLGLASLVGMFVVLMILYPSVRVTLQILNAIPTAFIGGVLALVITQQTLTVASLVGFISLSGIAVRNGILLVTHYFHLLREEGEDFSPEMVLRGSLERLAPVMMTALTAGIGLVPIVIGGQKPGLEILYPVATVILGGLLTSTFCEFLIHPGLFWRFSGRDTDRLTRLRTDEEEILRSDDF